MSFAMSRLAHVKPSASAGISQQARALGKAGKDIIDLGLGEPDFDTPEHIIEAAYEAAKAGQTRYPPTAGTLTLKESIVEKFRRDNGLEFSPDEIIVSNGAKQVLFAAFMASLEPDQEVIGCAPYFDSYQNMVTVVGGKFKAVSCHAKDGFLLQPDALEAAITPETRWLILNSPSNPAGATYTKTDFQALADVLKHHPQVLILSDEIYEHIVFDDFEPVSFSKACPELFERTLTVNGVSKAYAMTGWRIGFGAGPKDLITAMTTTQSQISSGACSVAQAAAKAALDGPQDCVAVFKAAYERRRNLVVNSIAEIKGLSLAIPKGAFYALIACEELIGKSYEAFEIKDDASFTGYLLQEACIASVPASAYGVTNYFRISTASSEETLGLAMQNLSDAVNKLI